MSKEIINPKYKSNDISLYKYYAGFSNEFVAKILSDYPVTNMAILDPWNGSGTTTRMSAIAGVHSVHGFDINPVMIIIASAELLDINEYREITFNSARCFNNQDILNDPLEQWFTKTSIRNIRNVEMEFRNILLPEKQLSPSYFLLKEMSDFNVLANNRLLAFYYLVFFETVKKIAKKFKSSNPTWIKVAKTQDEKIKISQKDFENEFLNKLREKARILKSKSKILSKQIELSTADSRNLLIEDSSIDLVVTSPPYCTRIDYTISTRIELAILGLDQNGQLEDLRKKMIGTTKIIKDELISIGLYSDTAKKFMSEVYNHSSKASITYYYQQFSQYFDGITQSISELNRVCKCDAKIYIVVQNSYYKDIQLKISDIFKEIFSKFGWEISAQRDFEKKQSMVGVNQRAKKYRVVTNPKESVLVFERRISNENRRN